MKLFLILSLSFILTSGAYAIEITATSPWLAALTNFIGGVNVSVNSLQTWNKDGQLARPRAKDLRAIDEESTNIIALDRAEFRSFGLAPEKYSKLRVLYDKLPFARRDIDTYFLDPSVLPFIAQRILPILSEFDPENYSYYQRRLAEFQTRLNSTMIAWRQLIKGQQVCDLTGSSKYLLIAAGYRLLRPAQEEIELWAKWKQTETFSALLKEYAEKKIPVLIDESTPKAIRSMAAQNKNVILLSRPHEGQDLLVHIHSEYLVIWGKLSEKTKVGK